MSTITESQFMVGISVRAYEGKIVVETITRTLKGEFIATNEQTFEAETTASSAVEMMLVEVATELSPRIDV